MLRRPITRWLLLAAVLVVIGVCPAAVAPIAWASAGAATVIGSIPGPVLLALAVIGWLKHKPAPRPATA
jgi:hypothetical protein